MGLFTTLMKKFYRDERGSVRAANIAQRLDGSLDDLEKQQKNIEIVANSEKPNTKKIEQAMRKHHQLVHRIVGDLQQIMEFEFASYQKDIKEPFSVLKSFIESLRSHKKELQDPEIKEIITQLLRRVSGIYLELVQEVQHEVAEVDEVLAREITGARSAYSVSRGDTDRLAKLIEARELQKRDVDQKIHSVLQEVSRSIKKIDQFLKGEKNSRNAFVENETRGKWIQVGNEEFRRIKNGRWMVRSVGAKVGGVFASKKELLDSGVMYHELRNGLKDFYTHFKNIIEFVMSRAKMTKEILGHAGYLEHKVMYAMQEVESNIKTYLSGNKKMLMELKLIAAKEKKEVKKSEKEAVKSGQISIMNATAAKGKTRDAVAALIAGGIILGSGGAGGLPPKAVPPPNAKKAAVTTEHKETVIKEVIIHNFDEKIKKTLNVVKHFPFDVSNRIINQSPELKEFFVSILNTVIKASRDAGYDSYQEFIRDQNIVLEVNLSGYAGPKGPTGYNVHLSQDRANFIEHKLAEWSVKTGIPIVMSDVQAKGETGEKEVMVLVKELLKNKKSGDPIIKEIDQHLDLEASKTMKYWWKWSKKYKDPKRKAFALENLYSAIHKIAAVDAMLLAPHRKAVLEIKIEYQKSHQAPEMVASIIAVDPEPDPLPPTIFSAPELFSEKALLTHNTFPFTRTEERVTNKRFRGQRGYQQPNKKTNWMNRGPFG